MIKTESNLEAEAEVVPDSAPAQVARSNITATSLPSSIVQPNQSDANQKAEESTNTGMKSNQSDANVKLTAGNTTMEGRAPTAVPLYRPPHLSRQQNAGYSPNPIMNYPGSRYFNSYNHPVLSYPAHQSYPYYNHVGCNRPFNMAVPASINNYRFSGSSNFMRSNERPEFMRRFNKNQREDVVRQEANKAEGAPQEGLNESKSDTSLDIKSGAEEDDSVNTSGQESMSTKTSMSLINELVKFNKIKHEYSLLDEIGPAHKKVFYVQLKLGVGTDQVETYVSHNTSIKRAQQSVAEIALKETKFKKPTAEKNTSGLKKKLSGLDEKKPAEKKQQTLPPTVMLNALAMKLNLKPVYASKAWSNDQKNKRFMNPVYNNFTNLMSNDYRPFGYRANPVDNSEPQFRPSYYSNKLMHQSQRFSVKLTFAGEEFEGEGITVQAARHNAAEQALSYFSQSEHFNKAKLMSAKVKEETSKCENKTVLTEKQIESSHEPVAKSKEDKQEIGVNLDKKVSKKQASTTPSVAVSSTIDDAISEDKKNISEINLLHDYCNILNKNVIYELVQESGPSHAKKFVTKCLVDSKESSQDSKRYETVGEGNSKKTSKLNAAIAMLKIIKENHEPLLVIHLTANKQIKLKNSAAAQKSGQESTTESADSKKKRHKASKIDKVNKTMPEYGKGTINPVSRLIQIQQAKKNPEPEFELVSSTSNQKPVYKPGAGNYYANRRHEFVFQCVIKVPKTSNPNDTQPKNQVEYELVKTEGKASTKKLAKQNAADAMLVRLGYQSVGSPSLKPAIKNTPTSTPDATESKEPEPPSPTEKNESPSGNRVEKHVKFDESVVKHEIKEKSIKILKRDPQAKPKTNQAAINNSIEHQRINQFKAKLHDMNMTRESSSDQVFSNQEVMNAYKIAAELLESMDQEREDENVNSSQKQPTTSEIRSVVEFRSPTAEKLFKEKSNSGSEQIQPDQEEDQSLKMLIGSTKNYKKALDYLASVIGFNVNYQSVLWRDNTVKSSITISIAREPEKPLSGQGSTHTESSNAAALCTLKYLASKYNSK